jgi:hypothetical protein
MADAGDRPVVMLTLVPAAGFGGDPYQRLKRWLKLGRRVFGWACVEGELLLASAGGESHEERQAEAASP